MCVCVHVLKQTVVTENFTESVLICCMFCKCCYWMHWKPQCCLFWHMNWNEFELNEREFKCMHYIHPNIRFSIEMCINILRKELQIEMMKFSKGNKWLIDWGIFNSFPQDEHLCICRHDGLRLFSIMDVNSNDDDSLSTTKAKLLPTTYQQQLKMGVNVTQNKKKHRKH